MFLFAIYFFVVRTENAYTHRFRITNSEGRSDITKDAMPNCYLLFFYTTLN